MKSALVLGSNSFGGASVVSRLLTDGWDVLGVSRSKQPTEHQLVYSNHPKKGLFSFKQLHLLDDTEELFSEIKNFKPGVVIDFAGQGMVAESWKDPQLWYDTNIVAKSRLHMFLIKCDFLDQYIRASTPEVYGSTDELIDEGCRYNPSTPYAISHAATDMSLVSMFKQYGFPAKIGRFANFYGPRQQLYRIVPKACLAALGYEKLLLDGGGKSVRSFIHGKDVASGVLAMMSKGSNGSCYHFSTKEFVTIADLVKKVAHISGRDINDFVAFGPDRPGKDQAYLMSAAKAKRELGWEPAVNIDCGLLDSWEWVRENFNCLVKLSTKYKHKR